MVTIAELLAEPLQYEFMLRALAASVVAAVVCATLSCWLVLIGWSLMGDAVSHSVLPGVALAAMLGLPFSAGAVVFAFAAVGLISVVRGSGRIRDDTAIGVVFTTLFALGLVLISVTPSQTDLHQIVFGHLLGTSRADLAQVAAIGAVVLAVLVLRRRDLTLFAFDPAHAQALDLRPKRLSTLLLVLLALTAVVALQVVGVVLVVAMLVIPGALARLLTDRFGRMLVIAPTFAVVSTVVGLYVSFYADTAPGATIVLAQGVVFFVVVAVAPRKHLVARAVSR
ncbi:MAG: metal ABC transporter permease [Aeromicrobium sp.]|uniref:metal ABC transporter permease n=1 Tax=Aeromicrobium sp. TaxID=1871063 RepID=UPI0039E590FE